jgi:hypothetical protein
VFSVFVVAYSSAVSIGQVLGSVSSVAQNIAGALPTSFAPEMHMPAPLLPFLPVVFVAEHAAASRKQNSAPRPPHVKRREASRSC